MSRENSFGLQWLLALIWAIQEALFTGSQKIAHLSISCFPGFRALDGNRYCSGQISFPLKG